MMAGVTRREVVKLITDREEREQQRALAAKRVDQLTQLLANGTTILGFLLRTVPP